MNKTTLTPLKQLKMDNLDNILYLQDSNHVVFLASI